MLWSNLFYSIIKVELMKTWSALLISMFMMAPVVQANAQNTPCSKSMGGVSHCQNGKFVCNNGKISQSKKVCTG